VFVDYPVSRQFNFMQNVSNACEALICAFLTTTWTVLYTRRRRRNMETWKWIFSVFHFPPISVSNEPN